MVSSFCNYHHFGLVVTKAECHRILTQQVNSEVPGTYHVDGLYTVGLVKCPQFLMRSYRTPNGWCKRRLEPYEVVRPYEISDSVDLGLNPDFNSMV
jgi:hypothetical protein